MCDQGSRVGLCVQDYKSLCTAVTTCATLVVPKFDPLWPRKVGQTARYSASMSDAPMMQIWWPQCDSTAHKYCCDRLKTNKSRSEWPTFCVQSRFASGSLHTRLQVSVYSGYDLLSVCLKIWFVYFDPLTSKSRSSPRDLLYSRQVQPRSKFGDCRSAFAEIMKI